MTSSDAGHGATADGRPRRVRDGARSGRVRRRLGAAGGALALAGGLMVPLVAAPASAATTDLLTTGQELTGGQQLVVPDEQFKLTMTTAGDLVETSSGVTVWSSGTKVPGSWAVMQGDGNFVVYGPAHTAEWNSGTSGHDGAELELDTDGEVAVVDGATTEWESRTDDALLRPGQILYAGWTAYSPNGIYKLVMQSDGNLVEYLATPQHAYALWSSRTSGSGLRAVMQRDGNLTVYTAASKAKWTTGTSGHAGAELTVTNGADVELTGVSGAILWNSRSATLRTRIVSVADSQLGVMDSPAGTYCNPYSAYWGQGTECADGYRSEEWCADFAAWVWRQAGVSFTYAYVNGDLSGSAASFYHWAALHGAWHWASSGYVPQPGDVAVYGLDSSDTYADHAAVVVTAGTVGADVVNGDWWVGDNAGVVFQANETTAAGTDTLSGYASP